MGGSARGVGGCGTGCACAEERRREGFHVTPTASLPLLSPVAEWEKQPQLEVQVPLTYKLLGYGPEVFEPCPDYAPPLRDQGLFTGAEEEMVGDVVPMAPLQGEW